MIGIFDSGVGGMTVAHAIEQACPGRPFIYFGDLARTPYGPKSPETIRRYARQNIEFLLARGAKLIIIACNSAASVAAAEMRQEFDLPIFDVIGPAVARVERLAAADARCQFVSFAKPEYVFVNRGRNPCGLSVQPVCHFIPSLDSRSFL